MTHFQGPEAYFDDQKVLYDRFLELLGVHKGLGLIMIRNLNLTLSHMVRMKGLKGTLSCVNVFPCVLKGILMTNIVM